MTIGSTVGSYRLVRELGRGGMAAVYEAEHLLIGRRAAIKLLHPEVSTRTEIVKRFFLEAKAISAIRHPGIVEVYDFGYHDYVAYLVMELLEGETLGALLKRERALALPEAARIAVEISRALAAAHGAGVIHRDLKPPNIFLRRDRGVCLVDFGVAKLVGTGEWGAGQTQSGVIIGTPMYMSPEQCHGGGVEVDHRADLYTLGCVLYRMITGRPPFAGRGAGEVIARHLLDPPAPASALNPWIPPDLDRIVGRLLEKDPDRRFQSALELAGALERISGDLAGFGPPEIPEVSSEVLETLAPVDTTFGRASVELIAPPVREQRPRWPFVALGATLALAVALIATIATGGDEAATATAPEPEPELETATAPDAAVPVKIELQITSRPAGAEVVDALGASLGVTPLAVAVDSRPEPRALELRLEGYKSRLLTVAGDRDGVVELDLAPIPPRDPPAAKRAKKSRSKKTPTGDEADGDSTTKPPPPPPPPVEKKSIDDGALDPFDKSP